MLRSMMIQQAAEEGDVEKELDKDVETYERDVDKLEDKVTKHL